MSRFTRILLSRFFSSPHQIMALDLGNSFTKVMTGGGASLVASQALHNVKTGDLVIPESMEVVATQPWQMYHPFTHGQVTDVALTKMYLQSVLTKNPAKTFELISRYRGKCAVASNLASADQELIRKVLGASALTWELIPKKMALYHSIQRQPSLKDTGVIIDIGAVLTEVVIVIAPDLLLATTLDFGGQHLLTTLHSAIREKHNCTMSDVMALKILQQVNITSSAKQKMTIKGKQSHAPVPSTQVIELQEIIPQLVTQLQILLEDLRLFFSQVNNQELTTSLEKGIALTGGTSNLKGLTTFLADELGTEVLPSASPYHDVVRGLMYVT